MSEQTKKNIITRNRTENQAIWDFSLPEPKKEWKFHLERLHVN